MVPNKWPQRQNSAIENEFHLFVNVLYSVVIWNIRSTVTPSCERCNHCSVWMQPCILGTTVHRIFSIYIAKCVHVPTYTLFWNIYTLQPYAWWSGLPTPQAALLDEDWLISRYMTGCIHYQAVAISAGTFRTRPHMYVLHRWNIY